MRVEAIGAADEGGTGGGASLAFDWIGGHLLQGRNQGVVVDLRPMRAGHGQDGLDPAEAMLRERPVIATDWSGTQAFCTQHTSFPVPCRAVPLRP
ncbi:MAG: hypothetical protein AAFY66_12825, partial [Pseudomonadota bacterium]